MIAADELVKLAMNRRGLEKPSDLARALGLSAYASPRRVVRWIEGENEPDYKATMALLELVGALNEEALKPTAEDVARRAGELRERTRRARGDRRREGGG